MNVKLIILVLLGLVTTGCVTTSNGDKVPERDDKEAARVNMDLGISYLRQGNLEQAMVKLERSLEVESNNPTAHRLLGLVYERLGDTKSARKEYYEAVRQGPKDPDALNQLAIFLCTNNQDKAEALQYFERALKIPLYQQRYLLFTNAGTCAKSIDLALSENYLRQGLELNPNYPEVLLQLGDVAFMRGNYLQSRAFVERLLTSTELPSSQALWLGYRVENKLGSTVTAQNYAKQLLRNYPESAESRLLLEQQRNAG